MSRKNRLKIYMDNCCFNRPFDDQTRERIHLEALAVIHVQKMIVEGKLDFVWSYVLDYENEKNPFAQRKMEIRRFSGKSMLQVTVDAENAVLERANRVFACGIKGMDALHVACALHAGCACFLTTDDRVLGKTIEGIRICNPVDFVIEMERQA